MTEVVLGPEFQVAVRHNYQPEPDVDGLALQKGGIRKSKHAYISIHSLLQYISNEIHYLHIIQISGWAYGVNGDTEGWFPFSFVRKLSSSSALSSSSSDSVAPPAASPSTSSSATTPSTPSVTKQNNTPKLNTVPSLKKSTDTNGTTTDLSCSSDITKSTDSLDSKPDLSSSTDSTTGPALPPRNTPMNALSSSTDSTSSPALPPRTTPTNATSPQETSPRGAVTSPTRALAPVRPSRTAVVPVSTSQKQVQNQTSPNSPSIIQSATSAPPRPSKNIQTVSNVSSSTAVASPIRAPPSQVLHPQPPQHSLKIPANPNTVKRLSKMPPKPPPKPSKSTPTSPPLNPINPLSPPALPPKPANLKLPTSLSSSSDGTQRSTPDLGATSKTQSPRENAAKGGLVNSPSQGKIIPNGVSVFKPGAVPNGQSKPGNVNGLPHSVSAVNLSSKSQPLGAVPASHILLRSASTPNTPATQAILALKPSSKPKKPVKVLSKEMSLKIAVLLEDISALGAGSQHSAKNDEMEHYKEQYFSTADEFASTKADSLTPLGVAYADCTTDPLPDQLPSEFNVMFHFPNGVEVSIHFYTSLLLLALARPAFACLR